MYIKTDKDSQLTPHQAWLIGNRLTRQVDESRETRGKQRGDSWAFSGIKRTACSINHRRDFWTSTQSHRTVFLQTALFVFWALHSAYRCFYLFILSSKDFFTYLSSNRQPDYVLLMQQGSWFQSGLLMFSPAAVGSGHPQYKRQILWQPRSLINTNYLHMFCACSDSSRTRCTAQLQDSAWTHTSWQGEHTNR